MAEEAYLDFIKQTYRSPIKIITKVEGGKITQRLIHARCREVKISRNEKTTLITFFGTNNKSKHTFFQTNN